MSVKELYVVEKRRLTDFEALKWSGGEKKS